MITLYDLVFQDDRRPSPFCWRAKFALAHKGLTWTERADGLHREGQDRLRRFADRAGDQGRREAGARTAGRSPITSTRRYPDKPLFKSEMARSYARFINGWVDTPVHAALFPLMVGDLYDRVRPVDKAYIREVARQAAGHDATSPRSRRRRARRGCRPSAPCWSRRAGRCRSRSSCPATTPAYPDYALAAPSCGPRIVSPLELLEADDPVHAWRERMLDLFDGMGRKAKAA